MIIMRENFAFNFTHYLKGSSRLGFSFLGEKNDQFKQNIYGVNAVHPIFKNWILRSEIDFEQKRLITNNTYQEQTDGLYGDHQVGYQLFKGGLAYLIYEHEQDDLSDSKTQVNSSGVGFQLLPIPHVEFQVEYQRRRYKSDPGNPEHRSFITFQLISLGINMKQFLSINDGLLLKANNFYEMMSKRRTIRRFNSKDVPIEVVKECVRAGATAPSGANKQPWYFAIVKSDEMKAKIRKEAEKEEYCFYHKRNNEEWLSDLKLLKTNWQKPHLEEASVLIIIFSKTFEDEGKTKKCYYPKESVGIATGMLITAFHRLGLSTLTHTPSPMSFLEFDTGKT